MALHDLQSRVGYVPRESAMKLGHLMDVPLARIYEVRYLLQLFQAGGAGQVRYFGVPGHGVPHQGVGRVAERDGEGAEYQGGPEHAGQEYHLQAFRCLGCCGLAPLVSVNGKVYAKLKTNESHHVIERIQIDKPMAVADAEDLAD